MEAIRVVFISVPREEVSTLAKSLVEKRLAACVNIIPKTESYYWWDDKINHDDEALIIAKTHVSKVAPLIEYVEQAHPYDVPEVLAIKVEEGLPDYINWIVEESRK